MHGGSAAAVEPEEVRGSQPGRHGAVASMEMTVDGDASRVVLRGRLDASTVGDVRLLLHQALLRGRGDLVVDLSEADVADATGLGVLLGAHRHAERLERHLVLAGLTPRLERLLRMTRLHRILRREIAPVALAAEGAPV
jgi:anti-anti-sigma factor